MRIDFHMSVKKMLVISICIKFKKS